MNFFRLAPGRPGDATGQRPGETLSFQYVYWSPDPIFTDHPYFFVTGSFANKLRRTPSTGYSLAPVPTGKAKSYVHPPGKPEPESVERLLPAGMAGSDDFGIQSKSTLVVSDRVLSLLRATGLQECEVFDYEPDYHTPTPKELFEMMKSKKQRRT